MANASSNQVVPYAESDHDQGRTNSRTRSSVGLVHDTNAAESQNSAVGRIHQLKRRRKQRTWFAGLGVGIVFSRRRGRGGGSPID